MSDATSTPPQPHPDDADGLPFLVAGVGASAGGLEAYMELLEELPVNAGLSLLLVSHLDPDHKSHLAGLLGRVCKMPVREVSEGMAIVSDHVYVIPPGTVMALTDGSLSLSPRGSRHTPHMPIDHLFRSLAAVQKNRAVGIVLSGNGSDGANGLQTIKGVGGVTFAQDDKTAKYPGMPRAAALDGNVDHVMRPREIARELLIIARHPYTRQSESRAILPSPTETDPIAEIINLLRLRIGVDFMHYKQTTIRRRILRRMALCNLHEARDYLEVLKTDATEIQNLYQDFLIRVTQFFRDSEAFTALKEKVFPILVNDRPSNSNVRIWVAGCSSGEEAFSVAISLLEYLDGRPENPVIKILATDLNEAALEKARAGIYLENIEIDVSLERLRRFFVRSNGHYQISKTIRELCLFSRHNLTSDPPYSHLDLVCCRNVLIYMDAALQKRVMPLLHYSLNPNGFLFLGTSENVGSASDLFDVQDAKNHIFTRRETAILPLEFSSNLSMERRLYAAGIDDSPPLWTALDVQKEADRVLLARYSPVGVVTDETMTVLQFRGRTSPYLEPAPGMASLDLFRMLREGLLAEVRIAVGQAKSDNLAVVRGGLQLIEKESTRTVRVEVIPFKVPPSGVRFFLVLFQDHPPLNRVQSPPQADTPPAAIEHKTLQLQQEIGALREYLQSVIEGQESTNEELKSANEEILLANEELQSTNEELQTAKEEAQSANEELATVNDELRHRNTELARLNNDLVNLLSGVGIPIVMVSRDLRIRRFTPLAETTFNLIPADVGRPISDIKSNLAMENLPELIMRVIDSLAPHEGQVQDLSGHHFSLRIRPYVTLDNKIEGASVVLVDIDAMRRQGQQSSEGEHGSDSAPSSLRPASSPLPPPGPKP
jgi:two-component system CheB/CheR fusion protein